MLPFVSETARLDVIARALYSMNAPELAGALFELKRRYPSIPWQALLAGPAAIERDEWSQLVRNGKAFIAAFNQAAVAAQNTMLEIAVPLSAPAFTSALIKKLTVRTGTAGTLVLQMDLASNGFLGATTVNSVGLRQSTPATVSGGDVRVVQGTNAAPAPLGSIEMGRFELQAGVARDIEIPGAFLAELVGAQAGAGQAANSAILRAYFATVNIALNGAITWAEAGPDYR